MYSYELLEKGCYYLIQEREQDPVSLININLDTDQCMYVAKYSDTTNLEWKRKSDPIHDILELLGDEKVKDWQTIFNDNGGTYNYEEDEE